VEVAPGPLDSSDGAGQRLAVRAGRRVDGTESQFGGLDGGPESL
jgi:hypothetical protein